MDNLSILKNTLRVFGVAFVLIMPMMKLDPLGGWAWSPGQWEYEMMIQGVYMTLGIFGSFLRQVLLRFHLSSLQSHLVHLILILRCLW